MGLGRAHLGGWTIHSGSRLHPICRARLIRSGRYRVGDRCHPTSNRRIGRETWRAESCGRHCYGHGCAPDTARNHGTSLYTPCLLDRSHQSALLIKEKLQLLNQPLAIFDEIAHALSGISGGPESASIVHYDTSTIISGIVSTLTPVITQFLLFFFAMIFWMLYANKIKGDIAGLFSDDRARQAARTVLDDAENKVSQYFGTLVVVNLCLAAVAMGLASAVGLPNPLLWGVLGGTLNFVPYLGPAVMVATLFVIGLLTFPTLKAAFVAPIIWVFVTTLEGQFITPTIIGHRHTLNPFLI